MSPIYMCVYTYYTIFILPFIQIWFLSRKKMIFLYKVEQNDK